MREKLGKRAPKRTDAEELDDKRRQKASTKRYDPGANPLLGGWDFPNIVPDLGDLSDEGFDELADDFDDDFDDLDFYEMDALELIGMLDNPMNLEDYDARVEIMHHHLAQQDHWNAPEEEQFQTVRIRAREEFEEMMPAFAEEEARHQVHSNDKQRAILPDRLPRGPEKAREKSEQDIFYGKTKQAGRPEATQDPSHNAEALGHTGPRRAGDSSAVEMEAHPATKVDMLPSVIPEHEQAHSLRDQTQCQQYPSCRVAATSFVRQPLRSRPSQVQRHALSASSLANQAQKGTIQAPIVIEDDSDDDGNGARHGGTMADRMLANRFPTAFESIAAHGSKGKGKAKSQASESIG